MPPSVHRTNRFRFDPERADLPERDYQASVQANLRGEVANAHPGDRFLVAIATGGGKTLVSNNFAADMIAAGRRVLRVTLNWELTAQTAEDLCSRFRNASQVVGYFGAEGARAMEGLAHNPGAQVVFTTVQSATSRSAAPLLAERFDVVLIDEVHWGEGKRQYRQLEDRYLGEAVFVGFTATPRRWTEYRTIPPAVPLSQLIRRGILPRPELYTVPTSTAWAAHLGRDGDFNPTSLLDLAGRRARNELIVTTYAQRQDIYGKTIVFACNIEHTEVLAKMLRGHDVQAHFLHSHMKADVRAQVLADFRRETSAVLVNVLTAVHGLDVPDVRTVMLARPTTSDILLEQMVGRAVRPAPGKTHFIVVDFTDNVATLGGVPLARPEGFLGTRTGPLGRGPRLLRHEHAAAELVRVPRIPGYAALEGMLVNPQQTFGIEFELTHPDYGRRNRAWWNGIANAILTALRSVVPTADAPAVNHGSSNDNSVWNVVEDCSCGFEVTSRILQGPQGFVEVHDALEALGEVATRHGLRVNAETGAHVHLAWVDTPAALHHLLEVSAYYEPALLSLVAPSRADNEYAGPVREQYAATRTFTRKEEWRRHATENRYEAVHLGNLFDGYGTVEIRLHSGTIDAPKILLWTSLWMTMMRRALDGSVIGTRHFRRTSNPLSTARRGDIVQLARDIAATPEMDARLVARRAHVLTSSWLHSEHAKLARRVIVALHCSMPDDMLSAAE